MVESTWTQGKIEAYKQVEYEPLNRLYKEASLPMTEPAKRADYLAHRVLQFDQNDELGMFVVFHERGFVGALNHLEELTMKAHIRAILNGKAKKETIPVPMDD